MSAKLDTVELLSLTMPLVLVSAGFNHVFHALATSECQLVNSLNGVIGTWDNSMSGVMQRALSLRFPWLLDVAARLRFARAKAVRSCLSIMEEDFRDIFGATAYHHDGEARDLISNIHRANSHTARPKDRLSDTEMMGQGMSSLELMTYFLWKGYYLTSCSLFLSSVSTVAIAGLETTATSTTWALYELSRNERVQQKLRNEIRELVEFKGDDNFTDDDFCKMIYLDAFIVSSISFHCLGL